MPRKRSERERLARALLLLRKARRALRLADSVMEYCGGDAWEREATADDRDEFGKLYDEVMRGDSR